MSRNFPEESKAIDRPQFGKFLLLFAIVSVDAFQQPVKMVLPF